MQLGRTRDEFRAVLAWHARGILETEQAWYVAARQPCFELERWFAWKFPSGLAWAVNYGQNATHSRRLYLYRVMRADRPDVRGRVHLTPAHLATFRAMRWIRKRRDLRHDLKAVSPEQCGDWHPAPGPATRGGRAVARRRSQRTSSSKTVR
jgi:hypothetical protein